MDQKKAAQLGMNPSTAAHRLRVDLLYSLAKSAGHKCFRCGGELNRHDFSIEHKIAWLDSHSPKELYFDLNNVGFSHLRCNVEFGRGNKVHGSSTDRIALKRSVEKMKRAAEPTELKSERRRQQYLRTGR